MTTRKRSETHEMFYYTGQEGGRSTDFSGPDSLFDVGRRTAFLSRYAEQAARWFEDPEFDREVVAPGELRAATASLKPQPLPHNRKRQPLEHMKFATVGGERAGWRLYYKGAAWEKGELCLADRDIPPVPCAKYVLPDDDRRRSVVRLSMELWMDSAYSSRSEDIHYVGSIGRTVELRWHTLPAVKIKFYSTGYVKAFGGAGGIWHPQMYAAGTYRTGEWVRLRIALDMAAGTYDVQVDDQDEITGIPFPLACDQLSELFFDGGMHPGGTWRIRRLRIDGGPEGRAAGRSERQAEDSAEQEAPYGTDLLAVASLRSAGSVGNAPIQPSDLCEEEAWMQPEYDDHGWQTSELPLAVGGYEQRDRELRLRGSFAVSDGKRVFLSLESLDPHGDVWVNGSPVLIADDFLRKRVEITRYVHPGRDNVLAVRVHPRAPEVYYHWHRNEDSYHGWFCGRICIEETAETLIREPKVRTVRLLPDGQAEIEVEADIERLAADEFAGTLAVSAQRWFPEEERGSQLLYEAEVSVQGGQKAVILCRFVMPAEYWTPDQPVLYQFRLELADCQGSVVDDEVAVTGIRTIDQMGGTVRLNGRPTMLNGALLMQFLPPFEQIPVNHVCPSTEQIVWQTMMIKRMNGNTARFHMLGYGTNDPRHAEIADQLGLLLIWTTRLIDSLEAIVLPGPWQAREAYRDQALQVINHPSIIMWEGSNEFHGQLPEIDKMYDAYVDLFAEIDETRLLSPCSHLYYGGGLYGNRHQYYNDDGTQDQDGKTAQSSYGWKAANVVRSCHPYILLNGYGGTWDALRKQPWRWQEELLQSQRHAYLVTEFAVTGDPNWERQVGEPWHHVASPEKVYEDGSLGRRLTMEEWRESQAFQCFAAFNAVKRMRLAGADGLMWCCLTDGANNVHYRKPPIDFHGRAKLGFYGLRMGFQPLMACHGGTDVVIGKEDLLRPTLLNIADEGRVDVSVTVLGPEGEVRKRHMYRDITLEGRTQAIDLGTMTHDLEEPGYYAVKLEVFDARSGGGEQ